MAIERNPSARPPAPDRQLPAENTFHGLVAFYNRMYRARGMTLPPHLYPIAQALADERIRKLMIILAPGSGKSVLTSIAYPAWLLGIDPTQNILAISAGATLPQDMMAQTRWLIEDNPDYRAIFPDTRPDRKKGWTDNGLFVTGHISGVQDASYYATGITSTTVTGKHGTTIILDDIHSKENSNSAESCAKVITSFYETIQGRRDGRGSRIIVVGRRWHPSDLYQHLKNAQNNFVIMECPAERQGTDLYWDVWVKDDVECIFNEKHT